MSLNGLDTSAVTEAHQFALADAGGWFLLKYANRDTVEVLGRGHGGVAEAKATVEQYEDKSPLFGMVQYRRKRVVLKYVPDGTSRLLQVRLTVQFQSILDAFLHDTVFSFTAAPELVESALGLCTMLQPTNGGSLKSSDSSLRQRRLNEISEDAEDHGVTAGKSEYALRGLDADKILREMDTFDDLKSLPASAIRAKALLAKRKEENEFTSSLDIVRPERIDTFSSAPPPLPERSADRISPVMDDVPRPFSSMSRLRLGDETENPSLSFKIDNDSIDEPAKSYHHSRHLSENESANISQWNDQVAAYSLPPSKPKKKLGPRPHVESSTRPKTATPYDEAAPIRPVANLPQSVRVSNRPSTSATMRPGSQQSVRSVPTRFIPNSLPPPLPENQQLRSFYNPSEVPRAMSALSSNLTEASTSTPEKLRLMKALQQRKRTQLLAQRAASAQPTFSSTEDDFPLGVRPSIHPSSLSPVPATVREEIVQASTEVKSLHASSTASPTSTGTTSENTSTRPSSFAEDVNSHSSQKSISLDTNSSSTPKALARKNQESSTQKDLEYRRIDVDDEISHYHQTAYEASVFPTEAVVMNLRDARLTPTQEIVSADRTNERKSSFAVLQSLQEEDHAEKRRHLLGADLSIPPSTEASSVFSDDDALIEELKSATVQEATPVSVVRPPLSPTMRKFSVSSRGLNRATSSDETPKSTKTGSIATDRSPTASLRNGSTALPQLPPVDDDKFVAVPLARKSTLGDGITKRIKALEVVTRRDTKATAQPSTHDAAVTRNTFSNLMKRTSFISQFQSSTTTLDRQTLQNVPKPTTSPAPVTDDATDARPFIYRQVSASELYASDIYASGPVSGTVSVTARIIRDQDLPSGHPQNYDYSNIHLHRSPLSVEHNRQDSEISAPSTYYSTPLSGMPSPASPINKRFSFASHRSGSTVRVMQADSMASRLSLASKDKRTSRASASETSSIREEKRASRTSRLMKRMSGFGSRFSGKGPHSSSKSDHQPDAIMEHHEGFLRPGSVAESLMQMIDIGYVNVQFPESLLWKRRFLRIDDQGFLIFSAPTEHGTLRGSSRKFHLADVQEPCLPDHEREEMAWSVLLDLRDGNCIQCACESKEAQIQVLKMLLDAHSAYHSLYPGSLE